MKRYGTGVYLEVLYDLCFGRIPFDLRFHDCELTATLLDVHAEKARRASVSRGHLRLECWQQL